MNAEQKKEEELESVPLALPIDFDEALTDLMQVKPKTNAEIKKARAKKKDAPKK